MSPIHVFIVSDVRLHRDGLAALLSQWPLIDVLGAHTLCDATRLMRTTSSDVALLDLPRPNIDRFLAGLHCLGPRPRIVAVGIHTASELLTCAAAGIDAFVGIDAQVADMVATIERVAREGVDLSKRLAASLSRGDDPVSGEPDRRDLRASLTPRELQVADLMNRGLANKEIARRLGVEPCTAKNHVRNIMQKLSVHRRGTAVAKLRELIGAGFSTPIKG
jgi:DNA-binding NarL/FixJ family response regulator